MQKSKSSKERIGTVIVYKKKIMLIKHKKLVEFNEFIDTWMNMFFTCRVLVGELERSCGKQFVGNELA